MNSIHQRPRGCSKSQHFLPFIGLAGCLFMPALSLYAEAQPRENARVLEAATNEKVALRLVIETRRLSKSAVTKGDWDTATRLYEDLLANHPDLFPDWRSLAYLELGEVYLKREQPAAALALYDRALAEMLALPAPEGANPPQAGGEGVPAPEKVSAYARLRLVRGKVSVLRAQRKTSEIKALLQSHLPLIAQAGQQTRPFSTSTWAKSRSEAAGAMFDLGNSTWGQTRFDSLYGDLLRFWNAAPMMLEEGHQRKVASVPTPVLYTQMLSLLAQNKRHNEALSWAKLCFLTCDFEADAIERSMLFLGQSWAGVGQAEAVAAFDKAQSDATHVNPLHDVPLPALDKAQLRVSLTRTLAYLKADATLHANHNLAVHDAITTLIALGEKEDLGLAMSLAKRLWQSAPDKPDGAREVCRVFKGTDGSVARANLFLAFLERNAQGQSPLDAFFQIYPEQPA